MNLADITTKCYILALIIRDDGERLLLGDGAYEFKDGQQHFIANTYANDVVELQGTDGQMLAGQVRRTATQTFAGYIGDATFSKQRIEAARRDFLMFFRKKHYYTAVYVFSDGTAIQRDRGYIVNAPSVPELYQRFPEWSVGLNFEDPNYYEYAEDDLGQEIAAHKVELELSTAMSGGLIWDGDGAVSDDLSYVGTEIPGEGKNFQLTDTGTATLKSAELLGDTEQDGTPTPDAPQAVNTVTGEQTVKIEGKNLYSDTWENGGISASTGANNSDANIRTVNYVPVLASTTYTASCDTGTRIAIRFYNSAGTYLSAGTTSSTNTNTFTTPANTARVRFVVIGASGTTPNFQLELGSTATDYEQYQGQTLPVNLGKNLLNPTELPKTQVGVTGTYQDGIFSLSGTASVASNFYILPYATGIAHLEAGESLTYYIERVSGSVKVRFLTYFVPDDGSTMDTTWRVDLDAGASSNTVVKTATKAGTVQYVQFFLESGVTYDSQVKILVQRGNIANPTWSPYFTPIELAKIGTYQDRIYKDEGKWYIEKQVGKVTLDGSNDGTWTVQNSGTANFFYVFSSIPQYAVANGSISNYFTRVNISSSDTNIGFTPINNTTIRFRPNFAEKSLADWKTWLSTHNTTVYYALATPTTTEITNSELVGQLERLQHAHTYADTTNFSVTATSPNLPAFLKVVAFGDDAIPQGGYVWEDGGTGGATTITVDGVDNAQPIWTVVGPATNPSLTNITIGESIQWTGVVPNGQTLVVNMSDMTASLSGANVFEFISGSWITLQAGNNRVSYSATAATGIATLEWNGVVG